MFYCYIAYYRGIPVYVGKGRGERLLHVTSGKSHNAKLNEFYFRHIYFNDFPLEVRKVDYFEDEFKALRYEKDLIQRIQPYCNKIETYCIKRKLSNGMVKFLSRVLDAKISTDSITTYYDENLLLTPYGLNCEVKDKFLHKFLDVTCNGNFKLKQKYMIGCESKMKYFMNSDIIVTEDEINIKGFDCIFKDLSEKGAIKIPKQFEMNLKDRQFIENGLTLVKSECRDKKIVPNYDEIEIFQVRINRNIEVFLTRHGYDFKNIELRGFKYMQISRNQGFCVSKEPNECSKTISLTRLNRLGLENFEKSFNPSLC